MTRTATCCRSGTASLTRSPATPTTRTAEKTFAYDTTNGAASSSNELAAWTWDTLAAGKLTQSVAYAGGTTGTSYTQAVTGYNAFGLPQGTTTRVSAGPWLGTYRELFGYTTYGNQESTISYPAGGGLPSEQVSIGYDAADQPISLTSSLWTYVATLSYTELGQPQEYALGTTSQPAWIRNAFDPVNRLATSGVQAGASPVTLDATTYDYNDAGLITSASDTPASGPAQVQCFSYDYLGRLTQAWSKGTTGCPASPSQAAEAGAAGPYWDQYTYDNASNLTAQVSTPATGAATTMGGTFPLPGSVAAASPPAPPHGVSSQSFSTTGSPGTTTTYAYDAAGHVTSIAATPGTRTLAWSDAGQLTSVTAAGGPSPGTASYAYDADGSLLLQQDASPGLATLYLAGEQLTETTGATPVFSSARYYAIGGATVAVRTSDGQVTYLAGNQQGTATLAVNAASLAATRRYFDPYGNPVGAAATAWPGTRGFVGGTADAATGLTNLGAREYNPGGAAFISPDPLVNPYQPAGPERVRLLPR
jgi:RHS repeat-associated protein